MASICEQLPGTHEVIWIPFQVRIISRHAHGEYTTRLHVEILPDGTVNGLTVDSVIDCLPYFVVAQRAVARLKPQKQCCQLWFAKGFEAWIVSQGSGMIGK